MVKINTFLCPSDANPGSTGTRTLNGVTLSIPAGNYPNSMGNLRRFNNPGWVPTGPAYYPGWDDRIRDAQAFQDAADGLANTVIFSEWVKGPGSTSQDGLGMVYGNNFTDTFGGLAQDANFNRNASATCQKATKRVFGNKGEFWALHDPTRGGAFCMANTPNLKACYYRDGGSDADASNLPDDGDAVDTMIGASSQHPGGVNCLFMDGSVKFIKNSINQNTWLALASVDGGETISADAY